MQVEFNSFLMNFFHPSNRISKKFGIASKRKKTELKKSVFREFVSRRFPGLGVDR